MSEDYGTEMKRLASQFFSAEIGRRGMEELVDEEGRPTLEAKRAIRKCIVLAQTFMGEVARVTRT